MDDEIFWDEMRTAFAVETSMDAILQDQGFESPYWTGVRDLVDKPKAKSDEPLMLPSGSRVAFVADINSVLSYSDCPGKDMQGTVIMVKTAEGNLTQREGRVFVLWDDGKFRPILAEHLRKAPRNGKVASTLRMTASSLGDLSGLFTSSTREDELVHRATQDLWSLRKDEGQYVIERLFDDTGKPLKV